MRRSRLVGPLVGPSAPRLILVVAPPGSGKSTLLAHLAEAASGHVAWLTLDTATVAEPVLLAHLRAAFGSVPGLADEWPTAEVALADLEDRLTEPVLLVLDDVHTVDGEPAAEVIRLLIRYQPEFLRIALGSRTVPEVDIPRWRLTGAAMEVDADLLRFRTWEVEELFREWHGVRLRADEVTTLTQRTGGWAAGLQLFHLATQRRPPSSRAALLAGSTPAGRLTRDYLARHVLDQIPPELQEFLIRSSVLDELTAARCDALLETTDAAARLSELDRIGLFTSIEADAGDGGEWVYTYHEVLRSHLLAEVSARLGPAAERALHRRAADLLAAEGAYAEAIRSYCRAQDWEDVRRVLSIGGASLADDPGAWIDALPVSIRDGDPWALLALGRRLVAEGVLDRAAETYQRAVERFAVQGGSNVAASELRLLQAWITPAFGVVVDWVHIIRAALVDPREQLRTAHPATPGSQLALGFAHLISGGLTEAVEAFDRAADGRELPALGEAGALLGRAVSLTMSGAPGARTAREEAAAAAKHLGAPVLARLADGLQAAADCTNDGRIGHLLGECEQAGDAWGSALLRLFAGFAELATGGSPVATLEAAEREFRKLAAPALAAWATAAAALAAARAGQPYGRDRLADVERAAGVTGQLPYALALLAVAAATADPVQAERTRSLALRLAAKSGATGPDGRFAGELPAPAAVPVGAQPATLVPSPPLPLEPEPVVVEPAGRSRLRIRCLGGFSVERAGVPINVDGLRPQHRALLRVLCLHANRTVHREQLLEWFWAGRDPERSQHSLQVAISELRRMLEPDAPRGEWTLLRRQDSGYQISVDSPADSDVRRLEAHLNAARAATRAGDQAGAAAHLEHAIAAYTGDLLPDEGPAEWVVTERDQLREAVAAACEQLAAYRAAAGEHAEVARVARLGLERDRYRDRLWQLLIDSLGADGHPAAAATARAAYHEMLAEIGVPVPLA
ncbi:MAG TPA: BTAD domain-containing putative transcriptional regulator [Mycobacteriales bacterium]|nr:BTAD domain-containing putative transcriptional regulator [Mycobacteriales bacterium]